MYLSFNPPASKYCLFKLLVAPFWNPPEGVFISLMGSVWIGLSHNLELENSIPNQAQNRQRPLTIQHHKQSLTSLSSTMQIWPTLTSQHMNSHNSCWQFLVLIIVDYVKTSWKFWFKIYLLTVSLVTKHLYRKDTYIMLILHLVPHVCLILLHTSL